MQEVGELLERIGARGDHDAGIVVIVGEDRGDALGQLQPLLERELAAGDVGERLDLDPRVAFDRRRQPDELGRRQPRSGAIGDGAAGGDQPHLRQRLGNRGRWPCGQKQAAGQSCNEEEEEEATPRRSDHGTPVPVPVLEPATVLAAGFSACLCARDSQSVSRVTARSAVVA